MQKLTIFPPPTPHSTHSEAHSGTPEAALGKLTKDLIAAGYKVARVEQTETPAMLNERKKNAPTGKKPQVVNREVCSVSTVGTRTYCYLDDSKCFENADAGVNVGGGPLLVIRECMLAATPSPSSSSQTEDDDTPPAVCEYGVCVVDAIRGNVTLGQFADDVLRSRLHTLLCTVQPSEIITDTTCRCASEASRERSEPRAKRAANEASHKLVNSKLTPF